MSDQGAPELSKQERLDCILSRVRSGQSITEALKHENAFHWFYRTLSKRERAPVVMARREHQQRIEQGETNLKATTSFIVIELVPIRKRAFQAMCDELGITMTKRIGSLITADVIAYRDRPQAGQ